MAGPRVGLLVIAAVLMTATGGCASASKAAPGPAAVGRSSLVQFTTYSTDDGPRSRVVVAITIIEVDPSPCTASSPFLAQAVMISATGNVSLG